MTRHCKGSRNASTQAATLLTFVLGISNELAQNFLKLLSLSIRSGLEPSFHVVSEGRRPLAGVEIHPHGLLWLVW